MRPIKLSMTAFGPFAGKEIIDFEAISKEPVFLICGPTGAGKTTIFDAISYALFGDASGDERKPDGMRSDFAAEDVLTEVELIFEVKGKRYQVMRQPRQFRRKKTGEGLTEVAAKTELTYRDDKGEPLVFTKAAEITEKMKEIIGLGSEQFKQIMMLPQGEFRKLLTADSKEREAILRELFDAERYLRFQLNLKEESDKLEKEIKEIRNIQNQWILQIQAEACEEPGSLAEILKREEIDRSELFAAVKTQNLRDRQQSDAKKQQAEQIGTEINLQKEMLFRKQQENEKLQERNAVRLKMEKLVSEADAIRQKEEEADRIQKAISLKPYAENCRKLASRIDDLQEEKTQTAAKLEQSNRRKDRIEQEYQIRKTPEYREKEAAADAKIEGMKQQIPLLERLLRLKAEYAQWAKEAKKEEQNWNQAMEQKKRLQDNIKSEKAVLVETEDIESKKSLLEKKQSRYHKVKEIYERFCRQEAEVAKLNEIERKLSSQLVAAEQNYRAEAEKTKHNHIIALRSDLHEGDICPVCHGIFHVTDEMTDIGGQTADLEKAEQALDRCRLEREAFYRKQTEWLTRKEALYEQLIHEAELEDLEGIASYLENEAKEESADEARAMEYLRLGKQRKQAGENLKQLEVDLEAAGRREENAKLAYDQKRSHLDQVIGEGKNLKESILDEYQEMVGAESVLVLKKQLSDLESEKKERQRKAEELENDFRRISSEQVEIKTRYEAILQQEVELHRQHVEERTIFLEKQAEAGFDTETLWQEAVAGEDLQPLLVAEVKNYREEFLKTSDLEKRLQAEVKITVAHDLQEVTQRIAGLEEQREKNTAEAILLLDRAKDNGRILHELSQMEERRERQKNRFAELSGFAKAANGENSKRLTFERYVLAAFLDDVLQMANYRLEKMTGRYSLKRKEEVTHRGRQSGLEIEVFDAFTGKTRSIHTLSGGEGFKSALAMALGLSEVVSSYAGGIELDMLFIDEGFGTLDPESIDTAIDCIMDLQAKGKIIGIISHVSELKERIPAKLEVRQTPKGSYTEYRSADF